MNKRKIFIFACVFCVLFIFFNSSQVSSVSNVRSRGVVNDIVMIISKAPFGKTILNHISLQELNLLVRKIAHAFEFFLLTIAICCALKHFKINDINIIIYSLFIILLIATLDEFLQMFIQDRTSSVKDVLIDFSGGILANILFYIFSKPSGKHFKSSNKNWVKENLVERYESFRIKRYK